MRATREANPFRPFTLRLTDGRSFHIPHRNYVSMSPGGRTVIIYQTDESFSILDLLLVTELSIDPPTKKTADGGTE
jgi:hypothetical protein